MPLKLIPPREGKSPNYTIRGTYLGQRVDRTSGSPDRATARQALKAIERDIERGSFSDKPKITFAGAAVSYLKAGGEDRFLRPLVAHFGTKALDQIDQEAIDDAAHTIYPHADNATRNRQVYTPLSAILKRAGIDFGLKDLKLSLLQASGNKIGSLADSVLLYCFLYDPSSGKYSLLIVRMLQVAGVMTMGMIAAFWFAMSRGGRPKPG